jgi:hypothetical protein
MKYLTDELDRKIARESFNAAQALRNSDLVDSVETLLKIGFHLTQMYKYLRRSNSIPEDIGLTQAKVDSVDGIALITYKLHVARITPYFDYAERLVKEIRGEVQHRGFKDSLCVVIGCAEENLKQIMSAAAIFEARRLFGEVAKLKRLEAFDLSNTESPIPLIINRAYRLIETYVEGDFEAAFGVSFEAIMVLF